MNDREARRIISIAALAFAGSFLVSACSQAENTSTPVVLSEVDRFAQLMRSKRIEIGMSSADFLTNALRNAEEAGTVDNMRIEVDPKVARVYARPDLKSQQYYQEQVMTREGADKYGNPKNFISLPSTKELGSNRLTVLRRFNGERWLVVHSDREIFKATLLNLGTDFSIR